MANPTSANCGCSTSKDDPATQERKYADPPPNEPGVESQGIGPLEWVLPGTLEEKAITEAIKQAAEHPFDTPAGLLWKLFDD
jgi:hypothetical protein